MKKLETIKENIPKMIRFAPLSMLIAMILMFMGSALILSNDIFGKGESVAKLMSLLVIAMVIFTWASLHRYGNSKKAMFIAYGVATVMVVYLGGEILFSHADAEVVFFKSFFITMGFILAYVVVPFWRRRDKDLEVLTHLLHLKYALLGSFRLGLLWLIALLIVSQTIDFLFGIGFEKFFGLLGLNGFLGYFFYLFFSSLAKEPQSLHFNIEEEGKRSYLTLLLYLFTAVIFTALNLFVLKIIITQELPRGQVAWMVMGFSLFAFLSYLSLIPYQEKVKKYGFLIWGTLLVQSFVLLGSVGVRVWEYGFTEKRYLLVAYGLWMMGISLYFLWQREKSKIFWIFASLWMVVMVSQLGPLSGYSVSRYSQQERLHQLYEETLSEQGEKQEKLFDRVWDVVRYLSRYHGDASITEVLPNVDEYDIGSVTALRSAMGMESYQPKVMPEGNSFNYYADAPKTFTVTGYDYFFPSVSIDRDARDYGEMGAFTLEMMVDSNGLLIVKNAESFMEQSMEPLLKRVKALPHPLRKEMTMVLEDERVKVYLEIYHIYRSYSNLSLEANVWVKVKGEK